MAITIIDDFETYSGEFKQYYGTSDNHVGMVMSNGQLIGQRASGKWKIKTQQMPISPEGIELGRYKKKPQITVWPSDRTDIEFWLRENKIGFAKRYTNYKIHYRIRDEDSALLCYLTFK